MWQVILNFQFVSNVFFFSYGEDGILLTIFYLSSDMVALCCCCVFLHSAK